MKKNPIKNSTVNFTIFVLFIHVDRQHRRDFAGACCLHVANVASQLGRGGLRKRLTFARPAAGDGSAARC